MIVNYAINNLTKKRKNLDLKLADNRSWKIKVIHLCGKLSNNSVKSGVYEIVSNMTERSSFNDCGVIGYIYINSNEIRINYQPTYPQSYKLRFHDFSVTVFDIRAIGSSDILKFSEFAVQLEITEAYGWI